MKRMLTLLAISAVAFTFTGCKHCPFCHKDRDESSKSASAKYTCTMCGYTSETGGKCPKCGGEMKKM